MAIQESKAYSANDIENLVFKNESFLECVFDGCNFHESNFQNARFTDCTFKRCNLHLLKLEGCCFNNVIFEESKCVGLDFYKCEGKFLSIKFESCVLMGCNLSNLKIQKTSFGKSKIKDCAFTDTILIGSNFAECDLEGSVFHNADLSKTDFREAKNYSINPELNKLKQARFSLPEALSFLDSLDILIE